MAADLGGIDKVLLFYGVLGDQRLAEPISRKPPGSCGRTTSAPSLWCLAPPISSSASGHGVLAAVSSVAGVRGRQRTTSTARPRPGLAVLSGLAQRLAPRGVAAVL